MPSLFKITKEPYEWLPLALKLRSEFLFRELALWICGIWTEDPFFRGNMEGVDGLGASAIDSLEDAFFEIRKGIQVKVAECFRHLCDVIAKDPKAKEIDFEHIGLPLPLYFKTIVHEISDILHEDDGYAWEVFDALLQDNTRIQEHGGVWRWEAGEGRGGQYFLCGDISVGNMSWDRAELDW